MLALSTTLKTSINTSDAMEIGDTVSSPALIVIPYTASSVSLMLLNGSQVTVYMTSSDSLTISYDSLSAKQHELSGDPDGSASRYNYNYDIGTDNPLYLLTGSRLTYYYIVMNDSGTSNCPARIYLFKNEYNYNKFTRNLPSNYNAVSSCLQVHSKVMSWSFNITDSSEYYVGLEIEPNFSITSNVSIHRLYYNTTGLALYSECHTLTSHSKTCQLQGEVKPFTCKGNDLHVLLQAPENIYIQYSFKKLALGACILPSIFLSLLVLIAIIIAAFCLLIVKKCCYKKRTQPYQQLSRIN